MKHLKQSLGLLLGLAIFLAADMSGFAQDDLPPNAEAGKCYAKCVIPDQYKTVTEQVLVKDAFTRRSVVPAVYGTVTERVLSKEASKKLIPVAAVYKTVTEKVLTKEEGKRIEYIPAVYKTVTEQVVDKPEHVVKSTIAAAYKTVTERIKIADATTRWEKGKKDPNCLSADPDDCRVMCLVEVPAQYKTVTKRVVETAEKVNERTVTATFKTVTKRVVATAAATREVVIPAQFKTITRRVLESPASFREEEIPAQYKTITRKELKTDEKILENTTPAQYATVTKTVLVSKGGFTEWREVLCDSDLTSSRIRKIQLALKAAGYDPGPIDNVFGAQTRAALTRYQRDKGLPVGRLDKGTLTSLGVN